MLAFVFICVTSGYFIFSQFGDKYKIQFQEKIIVEDIEYNNFFNIVYGEDLKSGESMILVYIRSESKPHKVFTNSGVSKTMIEEKVSEMELKNELTYLAVDSELVYLNNVYDILDYLYWKVYTDVENTVYMKFDFKSGEFLGKVNESEL